MSWPGRGWGRHGRKPCLGRVGSEARVERWGVPECQTAHVYLVVDGIASRKGKIRDVTPNQFHESAFSSGLQGQGQGRESSLTPVWISGEEATVPPQGRTAETRFETSLRKDSRG